MIPKRIVLDTNVCLDLFVFHDPRWARLDTALRDGSLQAVTRADCRREWQIVLGYPHLPLNATTRPRAELEFDRVIDCLDFSSSDANELPLPLCSDGDDQKFLELARTAGACALLTKDKALLKLARKTARAGLFMILTPSAWLALPASPAPAPVPASALE